jgi:hypothetical protein
LTSRALAFEASQAALFEGVLDSIGKVDWG